MTLSSKTLGKSTTGAKKKPFNMRTKSGSSANPMRSPEGVRQRGGNLRDKATINRLNMYKGGKPIRTNDGKVRATASF
jgi:nuclear GTP-binding protein